MISPLLWGPPQKGEDIMEGIQAVALWIASQSVGLPSLESKFITASQPCRLYAVVGVVAPTGEVLRISAAPFIEGLGEALPWNSTWGRPPDIRWYRVEHEKDMYRNGPENRGWWAPIQYVETFLDTGWVIPCDVRPTILKGGGANLGTMHYRLEVIMAGETLRTPGKDAVDKRGVLRGVHRISIARDSSLVGMAFAWFNLPYIWASASLRDQDPPEAHQAEQFVGADCADLMIAVLRRWTGIDLPYRNSAAFHEGGALDRYLITLYQGVRPDSQGIFRDKNGKPIPVSPDGIQPGDFLVYSRHVALFSKDTPPLGLLDNSDLHIHTCNGEVTEDALQEGFAPPFDIRRWVSIQPQFGTKREEKFPKR